MGDATFNAPKLVGTTKPRLSLLSSKQSVIRLKSDEQIDQNHQPQVAETPDSYGLDSAASTQPSGSSNNQIPVSKEMVESRNVEVQRLNGAQNDEDKMNISKEDLIRLLSLLKTELQSKEIALAAIKCEQLKRLINPVEISRSSLASTYIALQDRLKLCDQNNNSNNQVGINKSDGMQYLSASRNENKQRNEQNAQSSDKIDEDADREILNILNTLLELLDRHPLLALPRDSIYCLDYNCSEISTKNYLNLKIQHLDNLINQHRRFRYYINDRLKRSEQRALDLTRELEYERNLKQEQERSAFRINGRTTLLKHIEQLNETIEKEKANKQAIVMTLLNEVLDERERSEALAKKLADRDSKDDIKQEARERILSMENELNNLSVQLKKQSTIFAKERSDMQAKIVKLEAENKNLKAKIDQKELTEKSREAKQVRVSASSPSLTNSGPRQTGMHSKQTPNPTTTCPAVVTRSSIGSLGTKTSPSTRSSPNNTTSSPAGRTQGSNNGSAPSTNRQSPGSATNQRSSPVVPRPVIGSNSESASVKPQFLFKSASVTSTNQQVRSPKTSANVAQSSNSRTPICSQPTNKPQVPAKPAQLLDQQRHSLA